MKQKNLLYLLFGIIVLFIIIYFVNRNTKTNVNTNAQRVSYDNDPIQPTQQVNVIVPTTSPKNLCFPRKYGNAGALPCQGENDNSLVAFTNGGVNYYFDYSNTQRCCYTTTKGTGNPPPPPPPNNSI